MTHNDLREEWEKWRVENAGRYKADDIASFFISKVDILIQAHDAELLKKIEKMKLIEAIFPGQPQELLMRKQYHNSVIDKVLLILSPRSDNEKNI